MKKIIVLLLLLLANHASGNIRLIVAENADHDLVPAATVLANTPSGSDHILCQIYVTLGDGAKDLDGSGGVFEFTLTVGGQTIQPSPEIVVFGMETRSGVWTSQFMVPAGAEVVLKILSPNDADDDVDVTAYLYDVFPVNVASGIVESDVQLIEGGDATDALDAALIGINLDQFMKIAVDGDLQDTVHDNSVLGYMLVQGGVSNYDREAHSFEEIGQLMGSIETTVEGLNDISPAEVNAEVDTALDTAIPGSPTANSINQRITAILADTGELQTDWVNEGRLDLLIDAMLEDTATTIPGLIGAIAVGNGSVVVDHDYGETDALAYKVAGVGVDNAVIRAYLTTDYIAGNLGSAYIKATTTTDVNGRWTAQMNLDPETYTLYYFKQNTYGPDTAEITVE